MNPHSAPPSPFVRPSRVGRTTGSVPVPGELLSSNGVVVRVRQQVTVADETYGMVEGKIVQILSSGAVEILGPNGLRLFSYPSGGHEPGVPLRLPWVMVN